MNTDIYIIQRHCIVYNVYISYQMIINRVVTICTIPTILHRVI